MRRKYEVWALYDKPVLMSRHWTHRGAAWAALRWQYHPGYGYPWLNHEVRERPLNRQI